MGEKNVKNELQHQTLTAWTGRHNSIWWWSLVRDNRIRQDDSSKIWTRYVERGRGSDYCEVAIRGTQNL